MNAITSILPSGRPVELAAAGLTVQVGEFTLRDLADLQAALDAQWIDPLTAIESDLDAAQNDADARRKLLAAAYDRAEAGPPVYGEPSGRAYHTTPEGMAHFLWVALRRYQPAIGPTEAAKLIRLVSASEYSQIWRIAHGSSTLKSIERMMGLGSASPAAREQTWGKLIDEICQSHPGWTYQDVYGLTMTEFVNARRMGEPVGAGVPVPMDAAALARAVEEQRARFYGMTEANSKGEAV